MIIYWIIAKKPPSNVVDNFIEYLSKNKEFKKLDNLLKKLPEPPKIRGDEDWTLRSAAGGGSLETVKFLVEEVGADIKACKYGAFGGMF